ncbi:MAG TPA: hypothetical protein PK156_35720, partial [Polyangium sp.]|nr:hypothetical protein [Polyangium sp.]
MVVAAMGWIGGLVPGCGTEPSPASGSGDPPVAAECTQASDCASGVCAGGKCQPAPTCLDNVQNAQETDVDCGGPACSKCANGKNCAAASDCAIAACTNGVCEKPACQNGTKDYAETDVDCGGAICGPCNDGKACDVDTDCTSSRCTAQVCATATCKDNTKNQGETGVDCGGPCASCLTELDPSVPFNFAKGAIFIYTGANSHQAGVVDGAIDPARAAILRGRVIDREQNPMAAVKVSVHGQPNLGAALTRDDGSYDLVINGGGFVTVDFDQAGVIPIQRQVQPLVRTWTTLDDVVMTSLDSAVTTIDLATATEIQVHQSTPQEDTDGPRRATVMFSPGTTAGMEVGNTTQPLTTL